MLLLYLNLVLKNAKLKATNVVGVKQIVCNLYNVKFCGNKKFAFDERFHDAFYQCVNL